MTDKILFVFPNSRILRYAGFGTMKHNHPGNENLQAISLDEDVERIAGKIVRTIIIDPRCQLTDKWRAHLRAINRNHNDEPSIWIEP